MPLFSHSFTELSASSARPSYVYRLANQGGTQAEAKAKRWRSPSSGGAQAEAKPKRRRSPSSGGILSTSEKGLLRQIRRMAQSFCAMRHIDKKRKNPKIISRNVRERWRILWPFDFFNDGRGRQNFFACLCHLFRYTHKTGRGTMIPRPVFSHSIISNPFCLIFLLKFAILKPTKMRTLQSAFPIFPFHVPPADFSVFPACLRSPRSR